MLHDDGCSWTNEKRHDSGCPHRGLATCQSLGPLGRVGVKSALSQAWLLAAVGILLFLSAGCTSMDLRGQPDPPSELSELAQRARPKDPNLEPFTFSNRARSIESDLGVR